MQGISAVAGNCIPSIPFMPVLGLFSGIPTFTESRIFLKLKKLLMQIKASIRGLEL